MNWPAPKHISRLRLLLAVASGVALALSFPNFSIAGLAWIAPAMMIAAARGTTGWRSFRIGYVAGFAFHLVALRWLLNIPVTGFPILGWVALSAFVALYQASWVWLVTITTGQGSGVTSWTRRMGWALLGAAAWVGMEMIQSRLFSGFPWNLLGASQYQLIPLIQIAEVTGVHGVSFVIVWSSLAMLNAIEVLLAKPEARYGWLSDVLLPLLVVTGLCTGGMMLVRRADGIPRETVRIACVQPNIPQTMIWNEADNGRRFSELMALTEAALTNQPEIIFWPEAALPTMLRYDEVVAGIVTGFAKSNRVWLIIGSDDVEPAKHPTKPDDADSFNASFLVGPTGEIAGRYCKRNLVIFGEYIPLIRALPFLKWFTPIEGGFTAGEKVVPFTIGRQPVVRTATLICFEDVFPHHARDYVQDDTDFLVNLTNDGWFGEGSEQWQHAAGAAFRAVENRVPLVRACNNGVTCWIDAQGRFRDVLRDSRGTIHGAGILSADIPLRAANELRAQTFYNQHGDWFGWLCVLIAGVGVVRVIRQRKKST